MAAFCLSVCLFIYVYLYIFLFRVIIIVGWFYNYYLGTYNIYCTRMFMLRHKGLPCLVHIIIIIIIIIIRKEAV